VGRKTNINWALTINEFQFDTDYSIHLFTVHLKLALILKTFLIKIVVTTVYFEQNYYNFYFKKDGNDDAIDIFYDTTKS